MKVASRQQHPSAPPRRGGRGAKMEPKKSITHRRPREEKEELTQFYWLPPILVGTLLATIIHLPNIAPLHVIAIEFRCLY
ncbi:hypothetical protein CDAR_9981 [Caerostris darwini]|uniref:Uncharacterized protein n=1 Tax=Caerostris darwini TaxID=1538125 RepID=A0AAV4QYY9_9ARAC|nr:hypothetical protein CDAR_9981 [Caerostris darwini]